MTGGCYRCVEGGCRTHPGDTHGQRYGTIARATFTLVEIDYEQLLEIQRQHPLFRGTPVFIAFDPEGRCHVYPYPSGMAETK